MQQLHTTSLQKIKPRTHKHPGWGVALSPFSDYGQAFVLVYVGGHIGENVAYVTPQGRTDAVKMVQRDAFRELIEHLVDRRRSDACCTG